MRAHVGRVLAALTDDELREVRDRLDVIAREAGHTDVTVPGEEVVVSGEGVVVAGAAVTVSGVAVPVSGVGPASEETVDDRSGWILER